MKKYYKKVQSNWAEVLKEVKLVLFNEYPHIVNRLYEWDDAPFASSKEEGEEGDFYNWAEVYQWYMVGASDSTIEYIEDITDGEIKFYWSELMGSYILPVYHLGTAWDGVAVEVKEYGWGEEIPEDAVEVDE